MRPYHRPVPNTWWLKRRPYVLFMIREVTSVFVAGYCVFLLVFIYRLGQGPDAYAGMLQALHSPVSIGLHLIALAFAAYHSFTWLKLAPQILTPHFLVLLVGDRDRARAIIAANNYVAWAVVSVVVAWVVLGVAV